MGVVSSIILELRCGGHTFWEVSFSRNLLYRETIREIGRELRVDGIWVDEVAYNRVLISAKSLRRYYQAVDRRLEVEGEG